MRVAQDHKSFEVALNPAPAIGELSVLFSGQGEPVGGHKIGPAVHEYFLIHTVYGGKGTLEIAGHTYSCTKGDTFVIFPDWLVSYESDREEPWRYAWVGFTGHYAKTFLSSLGITPQHPVVAQCDLLRLETYYARIRTSFNKHVHTQLEDTESSGWFRLLLYELGKANADAIAKTQQQAASGRSVEQAIRYMSLQYANPISIEQIAADLGYHRVHLSKIFKQTTGLSPVQYLFQIRMKKAEELLRSSLTIAQVAASVGYPDALYFSKQFRKWKGMTPSEFRKERKDGI
ncbi:AraC family transcriptional regulator [Xylanibacillus composti]|uniref:AraC family transcriptional regulator n=1 Tax=Xylanibacillus composti TaxID=1572762 RepID=A0A8J4H865_9BACL|nr:AraC family transcriptional regulator [Xylanibacillus composti]MDT9726378.1 AraC family transcriptional regulator [Xylanibacillus composti]GIQ70383.1 AraC family transcriptional regulator [Xylanibacillus composti]